VPNDWGRKLSMADYGRLPREVNNDAGRAGRHAGEGDPPVRVLFGLLPAGYAGSGRGGEPHRDRDRRSRGPFSRRTVLRTAAGTATARTAAETALRPAATEVAAAIRRALRSRLLLHRPARLGAGTGGHRQV